MDRKEAEKLIDKVRRTLELANGVNAAMTKRYEALDTRISKVESSVSYLPANEAEFIEFLNEWQADYISPTLNDLYERISKLERYHLLAPALRGIGYTETEVEECMEDVPDLTLADIAYVQPLYDNYDPATEEWGKDIFADYSQMKVFPKLQTSALKRMRSCLAFPTLAYIPLFDVSNVVEALSPWCTWLDGGSQGDLDKIKRMPAFDWASLESQGTSGFLYCALRNCEYVPPLSFPKFQGSAMYMFGDCGKIKKWDIDMDWSKVTNFFGGMRGVPITELPATDFPNATSLGSAWSACNIADLSGVTIRAPKCTDASYLFTAWSGSINPDHAALERAPQLELASGVNMACIYAGQDKLVEVPDYSHLKPSNIDTAFAHCTKLRRINGMDFAMMKQPVSFNTFVNCYSVEYLRSINLGQGQCTTYDFRGLTRWGSGSEENLQSLVDSLLTDSYDRAAAGMPVAKITLRSATSSRLTDEQKSAITAKGYTLVM